MQPTVTEVKQAYPLLNRLVEKFPKYFMPGNRRVSLDYKVAKKAIHFFIGVSSSFLALHALLTAPALFIPAYRIGLGLGATAYLVQKAIRRKFHYEDSWRELYIQGTALLKRKWRLLEACVLAGALSSFYLFTTYLGQRIPTWASRQSGLGAGVWAGYFASDLVCMALNRIFLKTTIP